MSRYSVSRDRSTKGIQLEDNQTHSRMSRADVGGCADHVVCESARRRGRIFQRLARREFVRQHGQPRLAHISRQWGQADRAIDDGKTFHCSAAFDGGQSFIGIKAGSGRAAFVVSA